MNAYSTNGAVKLDPTDKKTVREKCLSSNVIAVTLLDGQVKVLKNRFGTSGQTVPAWAFEKDLAQNEGVWLLGWWEAQSLLKGLFAL